MWLSFQPFPLFGLSSGKHCIGIALFMYILCHFSVVHKMLSKKKEKVPALATVAHCAPLIPTNLHQTSVLSRDLVPGGALPLDKAVGETTQDVEHGVVVLKLLAPPCGGGGGR